MKDKELYNAELYDAEKQARAELRAEEFREEVDRLKERLRSEKWWHRFVPFKIKIVRRESHG